MKPINHGDAENAETKKDRKEMDLAFLRALRTSAVKEVSL
jgi:hypothetical protein